MAMGGKNHIASPWHIVNQTRDKLGAFSGRSIAHRVGDINCCGPSVNSDFNGAAQVVIFCTSSVHGRPLHVIAQVAGMGDRVVYPLSHFILGQIWNCTMQGGGANECVDAWLTGVAYGFGAAFNIFEVGAG